MTKAKEPVQAAFTLRLDARLLERLDREREVLGTDQGFALSRAEFFAWLGKRFLDEKVERPAQRPRRTSEISVGAVRNG
jgi:hypothetical protein